eukprot:TRINITY_DN3516_c0_g1_i2.p1 TRINITY_DN3516_c0_g1~~TRINITY_DN3516_c0_g1_i2.p1  ORF type:complete len:328 (+),score=20.57 TRINITY_DN3516_c0_g1_i2:31-1014(+)
MPRHGQKKGNRSDDRPQRSYPAHWLLDEETDEKFSGPPIGNQDVSTALSKLIQKNKELPPHQRNFFLKGMVNVARERAKTRQAFLEICDYLATRTLKDFLDTAGLLDFCDLDQMMNMPVLSGFLSVLLETSFSALKVVTVDKENFDHNLKQLIADIKRGLKETGPITDDDRYNSLMMLTEAQKSSVIPDTGDKAAHAMMYEEQTYQETRANKPIYLRWIYVECFRLAYGGYRGDDVLKAFQDAGLAPGQDGQKPGKTEQNYTPPTHITESLTRTVTPYLSKKCAVCGKKEVDNFSLKKCARCRSMYYCSQTCQTQDWPAHKIVCTQK